MEFTVSAGTCYKLRIGGWDPGSEGNGTMTITVGDVPVSCPDGAAVFDDPPSGVVDARQPHDVNNAEPLQGFDTFSVTAPSGADTTCWSLCETDDGGLGPNGIASVVDNGGNSYTITLDRPITAGAATTLTYTPDVIAASAGTFIAHPGNVNGDTQTTPLDILAAIDYLNGVANPPWGIYSTDTNHDGGFGPADILRVIDLLNGAGQFDVWNGTDRPDATGCP